MTIDERLERLTDRHEALRPVELLTHAIDALRAERMQAATYHRFEAIRDSLERIATAHERRIADLETQAPG